MRKRKSLGKRQALEGDCDVPKKLKKRKTGVAAEGQSCSARGSTCSQTSVSTDADEIKKALGEGKDVETFEALDISDKTKAAIRQMGFTRMTAIQQKAIPLLLNGNDVVGQAKTGSGKTLAFVIPCVELMVRSRFLVRNGTAVIIIAPVRELCLQIQGVVAEVMLQHPSHTHYCVFGGKNPSAEVQRLSKGVNVLVATPGRLLDHLKNTRNFVYKNLIALVIDEADRILQQGFEEEMKEIIKVLPKERQTMLFSATQTTKVKDLIRLSFASPPIYVGVHDNQAEATCETLEQGYVVVSAEKRFLLLYTFLKKYQGKKIIVFFSACKVVQFFSELLNYIDVKCYDLHGKQKQQKRTFTFHQFTEASSGILLCTDVAARGLDIRNVDWIVQFDPPDMPQDYIHRVGRTARAGRQGSALLFLQPSELGFLKYLKSYKVPVKEWEYPENKLPQLIQKKLEKLIETNYYLYRSARDAYRAFILAYHSHQLKNIFNVANLDVQKLAASFGLSFPPTVDFSLADSARKPRKRAFGADWVEPKSKPDPDPYGLGSDQQS